MSRLSAFAIRSNGAAWSAASSTALSAALDSTTKCAYAAWMRFPVSVTTTGDLMYHADTVAPGNGTGFRTTSNDAVQINTWNGTTNTQLAMPRALSAIKEYRTGKWFHVMGVVDSVAGLCRWYVNGRFIGNSTTAAVAWTAGGSNRTTAIGSLNAVSAFADLYDLRHWAQGDADVAILEGTSTARFAMLGYPAGESIRLLAFGGANGLDRSGKGRNLTWTGHVSVGLISGPQLVSDVNARRHRRVARAAAAAGPSAAAKVLYRRDQLLIEA